jgi:hypothetical protein
MFALEFRPLWLLSRRHRIFGPVGTQYAVALSIHEAKPDVKDYFPNLGKKE